MEELLLKCDLEKFKNDVEKLYDFFIEIGFDIQRERPSLEFISIMCLYADIEGSKDYIKAISYYLLYITKNVEVACIDKTN